jgi:putative hemolysin
MSSELLIIAFLLLLNAFFALSEMAIVSCSKPMLRQLAKKNNKSAEIALSLAENPGRFLSTVQVGITLVGILAGAYGGATISKNLIEPLNSLPFINPHGQTVAVFIVVTCITYFSVVLGELVPKQFALNNAEKLAMFVARPMSVLSFLCTPVVMLLEKSATGVMKLIGITVKDEGMTEHEIKAVIEEGAASGAIEQGEHDVIQRVIRLGDRDVSSIMTHRRDVSFIDSDTRYTDIIEKVRQAGHSRYPVMDKDTSHILGIIKTKDIMLAQPQSHEDFNVLDHLCELVFLNEHTSCLEALHIFKTQNVHMAAVMDEYGTFEGIFTTSDLLEALVGIIASNYDDEDGPLIVQREDGSYLIDGITPIDEIRMLIDLQDMAHDGDYQTMAGFILNNLRTTPQAGAYFDYLSYRFEIVDMDGYRIDKILIQSLKQPESE